MKDSFIKRLITIPCPGGNHDIKVPEAINPPEDYTDRFILILKEMDNMLHDPYPYPETNNLTNKR